MTVVERAKEALWVESRALTAAYWGAVGAFVLAFYTTPYLPLIDYHQHVALAAIMSRMFDPAAPEHALYETNYITYNGGFHLLVAVLARAFGAFHAGRVVMSTYPVLFAYAALSVVRASGKPRWYAFLSLPFVYSRAMAWGFANWNLAWPVAVLGIVWFVRHVRGERLFGRLVVVSLLCAYGHIFALACLCLGVATVQLVRWRELGASLVQKAWALVRTPLPFLPGLMWCAFAYIYQSRQSFSNWEEAQFNGQDEPLWWKIVHLFDQCTGNFWDRSDVILVALAAAVALMLVFTGSSPDDDGRAPVSWRALFWVFFACYFVVPRVFMATWFIYERFLPIAAVFLPGALPVRKSALTSELCAVAATLAVASGLNTLRVWTTMGDTDDALAIVRDIPEGRRLIAVTYEPTTERISREVYVHLPAVYQAFKRGEIAYSFTKFESQPVHYKPGLAPPKVQPGFEWNPTFYDVRHPWARAYDITLVRSPDAHDPRLRVFRHEAHRVRLLSRHGRFYLYDTSALSAAPVDDEPQ